MKALNKICNKATAYKTWIDNLCKCNKDCTSYYSSHKYCKDIKANLLLVQNGVCAYTEIQLDDISDFNDRDWENGVYIGNAQFQGHLDHFDSSKRHLGKESWLWENFFFVNPTINVVKKDEIVYDILKPDRAHYNPNDFIDYNIELNIFIVSDHITDDGIREQVAHMIDNVLCLNRGFIHRMRKEYLGDVFAEYYAGITDIDDLEITHVKQFFTAFEMTMNKLKEVAQSK